MSNTAAGHHAETRAARYLTTLGSSIRQLNWKTKYCEIDIVAERAHTIHFVEVKYRRTSKYGYASEYITPKKLQRMQFAAEMWVQRQGWLDDYQLAVVAIDGEHMELVQDLFV